MLEALIAPESLVLGLVALVGFLGVRHLIATLHAHQHQAADDLPGHQAGTRFGADQGETQACGHGSTDAAHGPAPRPWHEVLEVNSAATLDEVRQAYRRKIRMYHPDKVSALGPEFTKLAEAQSRDINQAYAHACAERGST